MESKLEEKSLDGNAELASFSACEHGLDEILAMADAFEDGRRDVNPGENHDRHRESLVQFLDSLIAEETVEPHHPSGDAHGDQ